MATDLIGFSLLYKIISCNTDAKSSSGRILVLRISNVLFLTLICNILLPHINGKGSNVLYYFLSGFIITLSWTSMQIYSWKITTYVNSGSPAKVMLNMIGDYSRSLKIGQQKIHVYLLSLNMKLLTYKSLMSELIKLYIMMFQKKTVILVLLKE